MFKYWLSSLQEKCNTCRELQLVSKKPLRRDLAHTCQWGRTELNPDEDMKGEIFK